MAQYELILLGSPTIAQREAVMRRMAVAAGDFGLIGADGLAVRTWENFGERDIMAATVALYFAGDPGADLDQLVTLQASRTPIVPVVARGMGIGDSIPSSLAPINACFVDPIDTELDAVCALALECLGLLHEQRRVFVSYRRDDSREIAIQLHNELSAKGFDVFLDTHSIRPGTMFQEMLWHRLADCDVVLMLDTEGYFESKWTTKELGRTMAHGIHVLRLVWPGRQPTRFIDLSDTIRLDRSNLDGYQRLDGPMMSSIAHRTEALRSRSVAWRHRNLVAKLRAEVLCIGGIFEGVGPHHSVLLSLPNGLEIQAYPAVGVPTALLLNDVYTKTLAAGGKRRPCLVYDDTGLGQLWLEHLNWLNSHIAEIKAIKVANAAWELAGWDP